jgi:hypothetical protein
LQIVDKSEEEKEDEELWNSLEIVDQTPNSTENTKKKTKKRRHQGNDEDANSNVKKAASKKK